MEKIFLLDNSENEIICFYLTDNDIIVPSKLSESNVRFLAQFNCRDSLINQFGSLIMKSDVVKTKIMIQTLLPRYGT